MSQSNEFESLSKQLSAAGADVGASELQGFVCGVLAAGARPDKQRWQREVGEFLELDAVPADLNQQCLQLAESSLAQLRDSSFSFQPLLRQSAALAELGRELGSWCQGFLHGFGVGNFRGELQPTSSEALRDLAQIAQLDAEDVEESAEAERQLFELQEYVRMAALNIFTECAGGQDTGGQTLH